MAILITIALFVVLVATIVYAGYRFYARPGRVYEQLGGQAVFSMPQLDRLNETEPGLLVTVVEQIGEKMPVDPADATSIRLDLIAAGYRSDRALPIYLGIRVVACVALVILTLVFRPILTSNTVLSVVIPVGAGFLGFMGPSFVLDFMIGRRQERIRYGLPDALDLLVVSVEAGLGLDQAIQHVARELETVHPDVSDELELVNLEIRGGLRRVDALRNLAARTGEPELKKLVAIMVQTDRFGTSIADSLRTHSDFMRTRRRQEAEERANKVGVKLVFPIFFLILPSMLVVAAGPGILQIFKQLIPMMKSFQGGPL
jgi:tight adherence protein C